MPNAWVHTGQEIVTVELVGSWIPLIIGFDLWTSSRKDYIQDTL